MAIIDRHIDPVGLSPSVLNVLQATPIGPVKVQTGDAVYTKQTFASTINATVAVGTQPDFARNLVYQMSLTNGSASSDMISGGTFIVSGYDLRGSALTESVAATALASLSVASTGRAIFASLASDGISMSGFSLHTSASSASNSVSFSIGVGNIVGLANPIRSTNAVPYLYKGTSVVTNYTVITGPVGSCGISLGAAAASGSNIFCYQFLTR